MLRSGHDQHRAIGGHLDLARSLPWGGRWSACRRHGGCLRRGRSGREQRNGFGLVVIALERVLDGGVPAAAGIGDRVFAGTGDEARIALARFQRTDQCAGDFLFAQALGLFLAQSAIDQDVDIAAEAGGLGLLRLLDGIDELDAHLGREAGVAVQQVARLGKAVGFIEILDVDIALQVLDHLNGLVGETELLIGSGIEGFIVAVGQEVDRAEHAQDHQGIHTGVCGVLRLSCLEPVGSHITPSSAAIPWIAKS